MRFQWLALKKFNDILLQNFCSTRSMTKKNKKKVDNEVKLECFQFGKWLYFGRLKIISGLETFKLIPMAERYIFPFVHQQYQSRITNGRIENWIIKNDAVFLIVIFTHVNIRIVYFYTRNVIIIYYSFNNWHTQVFQFSIV